MRQRISATSDIDLVAFADADEWESWLAEHHGDAADIWLKIAKKGRGERGLTIEDALDVALCYGWIDSQRKGCDDVSFRQRYSPRRVNSPWSAINLAKADALIDAGRMREPGFAALRAALAATDPQDPLVSKSKRGSKPSNSSGSNSASNEPGSARK